jgi:hypothetical protein
MPAPNISHGMNAAFALRDQGGEPISQTRIATKLVFDRCHDFAGERFLEIRQKNRVRDHALDPLRRDPTVSDTFWPPNPKLLLSAALILAGRATLGM